MVYFEFSGQLVKAWTDASVENFVQKCENVKKKCEKNACSEGLGGVSALLSAQSVVKLGPAFCLHLPMVLWKVQVQEFVSTNSNPCSG